jgi:hypothetical protein
VTWEWGAAEGERFNLLYGGVTGPAATTSPFFLTLVDSLGVRQVLRFARIDYTPGGIALPRQFSLVAARDADTVHLDVDVQHTLSTDMSAATFRRTFVQMRGAFKLAGKVTGRTITDAGEGFFESYLTR